MVKIIVSDLNAGLGFLFRLAAKPSNVLIIAGYETGCMRVYVLALSSAICLSAVLPALATPIAPRGAIITPVSKIVTVAHHCGKGRYWVPAGYAKHGKWRAGHCASY